jgi:hypothetical protein
MFKETIAFQQPARRIPSIRLQKIKISVAKGKVWFKLVSDGRNYGSGREKYGHFIPPRLAQCNGSHKLP